MMFGKKDDVYRRHIELLGYRGKDKITGFAGVVDSVCFDLYGCVQISLKPPMRDNGEIPDSYWFDVTRIEIFSKERVVNLPNFYEGYVAEGKKGPADKPKPAGPKNTTWKW